MRKIWFCKKCNDYPDVIDIMQENPLVETRRWNGEYYELVASNSINSKVRFYCSKCSTRLIRK